MVHPFINLVATLVTPICLLLLYNNVITVLFILFVI